MTNLDLKMLEAQNFVKVPNPYCAKVPGTDFDCKNLVSNTSRKAKKGSKWADFENEDLCKERMQHWHQAHFVAIWRPRNERRGPVVSVVRRNSRLQRPLVAKIGNWGEFRFQPMGTMNQDVLSKMQPK